MKTVCASIGRKSSSFGFFLINITNRNAQIAITSPLSFYLSLRVYCSPSCCKRSPRVTAVSPTWNKISSRALIEYRRGSS